MSLKRHDSLHQSGGLRVAADDPHLVSLGGGRLSTAVTIHQLPVGETTIGSACDCSIVLSGSGVQPHHCTLRRDSNGSVVLYAERDSRVLLDGKKIANAGAAPTPLSQGVMITIGKSNYLRFNHPAEAELMRSHIGSNERISMPQIDFAQDTSSSGSGSGSSTDGRSPCEEFLKASSASTAKAAAQNNMNNFHSPKVFAADSVTVNTPAKDVLGANFTNFTKNLTQMFGRNEKNSVPVSKKVNNTAVSPPEQKPLNNMNGGATDAAAPAQPQTTTGSSSSVGASPKVPQQFSACYDRYPKPGSYGSLQVFPMNNVNSEMNTEARVAVPPPSGPASLSELHRQRAQIERMQAEEISKQEHDRLEEILKMCADFERQNEITSGGTGHGGMQSSPIVQNRIKTNGSLPREKKHSPAAGGQSAGHDMGSPNYYTAPKTMTRSGYENVQIGPGHQVHIAGAMSGSLYGSESFGDAVAAASPPKACGYVPQSPRTKIKTCVSPKRIDPSASQRAAEYEALVQSFEEKLRLEIQMLRDNRQTVSGGAAEAGKSRAPEPVYGTLEKRNKNVNNLTVSIERAGAAIAATTTPEAAAEAELRRANIARLREERLQLICDRKYLRACINTLKQQDEHLMREYNLENTLVSAELSTERTHLANLQRNIATLESQIKRSENQRNFNRTKQEMQQRKLKQTMDHKQIEVDRLGKLLTQNHDADASIRGSLNNIMDELDNHSKCYEDLEFQCLEEEAEWSAHHEDLVNDLRTLRVMAIDKKKKIDQLEDSNADSTGSSSVEQELHDRLLESNKLSERLRCIERELVELTGESGREQFDLDDDNDDDNDDDDDDDADQALLSAAAASANRRSIGNRLQKLSQSLFGSQEILASRPAKPATVDLMSRSINENMFYQNNNIETRTPQRNGGHSAPPLHAVNISEDITRLSLNGHDQLRRAEAEATSGSERNSIVSLKYSLSPPFQHKQPGDESSCDGSASRQKILAANLNLSIESDDFEVNPLERRVPSQDDIDRISKITLDAPISTQGASFKVIESIREIERNRQLLLKQQGSHVIEHERQKMHELKKKSHDEARAQYMQLQSNGLATTTTTTLSDGDERDGSYTNKDCALEQVATEAQQPLNVNNNQQARSNNSNGLGATGNNNASDSSATATNISPQRHSQGDFERSRPLSDANSDASYDILAEKPFKSSIDIRLNASNGNAGLYAKHHQHIQQQQQRHSQTSHDSDADIQPANASPNGGQSTMSRSLVSGSRRNLPKHQRPLTRYLPIMSLDLNLRQHIESAGHQVTLCPHVLLDEHSCRGYLHKLGATFHGWSRRWFLFDRQKMALIYFSDKSERKPRGGAYFSTIDEVYLDHMNTSKSGRPYCTFIVKTKKRSYHLQAASDAAARIWIDAIITGAQGNIDY